MKKKKKRKSVASVVKKSNNTSSVNHPKHYNVGSIEVIDAIEEWVLDFNRGNAVKYIARAGHKNPNTEIQDLEKARWYLNRSIALLKKRNPPLPKPN